MTTLPQDLILVFYADQCTGCGLCELTCSMAKHGEYNPSKSYIHILKNWEFDVNIAAVDLRCDRCSKCVQWCPTNALGMVSTQKAALMRKQHRLGVFPAPLMSSP